MMFKAFKPKLPQQEQGFTLVEVLVAILIATTFTLVTMQAVVIAAIFRTRAQQSAEATAWIQQDLEDVKHKAAEFQHTSLAAAAMVGANSINVATVDGFAVNDTLRVGSDPGSYKINNINGNTLSLEPNLGTAQPQDAVVEVAPYTFLRVDPPANASSIDVATVDGLAVNDRVKVGSDPGSYRISSIGGNILSLDPSLGTDLPQYAVVLKTPYTSLTGSAAPNAVSINVAAVADFAVNDTLKVGSDTGAYRISGISGSTLTITPPLGTAQSSGAGVVATKSCNSRSIVAEFVDSLPLTNSNQLIKTKTFRTGKEFQLTRTITPSDSNKVYNVLQVNYQVSSTSGGFSVANFYTEVIPNAALQCP
jgi:prepilin-type N-terminal cleavage/methylation domain-containing protein